MRSRRSQEVTSMQLLQKLQQILFYAGTTPEEYARILPEIRKNNHKRLQVFSGVSIFFLLVMVIITYTDRSLSFRYQTYLAPVLLLCVILLADIFFAEKHPLLCKILIYVFVSLLALLSIVIGTFDNREQTAGTFLAFLLAIPLLFIVRPIENVCFIAFFDVLFIIASASVKSRALFEVDMINALVFGGISIIISSFMLSITIENFVIKDAMTRLAETDQLTQLRNRTSYEQRLPIYPTLCKKSLACIYADVNGLHELNASKGHEAGDTMLKFIADALQAQFGAFHTYRIGGDEFVTFAMDTDADVLAEKLNSFIKLVESENYHISVGYALQSAENIQMPALIKTAEDKMYQAKQEFYSQNPTMRRRHPRCAPDPLESILPQ